MINLSVLTATALANGLNPCGIGLLITFLGYLLVFGSQKGDRGRLMKMGIVYIVTVFATYLVLGLVFYQIAYFMQRWWLAGVFKQFLGVVILIAGLIQIKDVVWQDSPIHLRMPKFGFEKINKLMARAGAGVTVLIGVLTTVFATPCMLPLYMGTTAVIARSGLPLVGVLGYFLYYNVVFILPMVVILVVMLRGKQIVEMKEWEHRNAKWLRLVMGVFLVLMGVFIFRS